MTLNRISSKKYAIQPEKWQVSTQAHDRQPAHTCRYPTFDMSLSENKNLTEQNSWKTSHKHNNEAWVVVMVTSLTAK